MFDVAVPSTQAFVGNGIVNHNTVNLPEEVTIEDVEDVHMAAWKLGLKAVALQHECDHLDGKVYLDRMTSMASLTFLPEFERYVLGAPAPRD